MRRLNLGIWLVTLLAAGSAFGSEKFDLRPAVAVGATSEVSIEIEIGGDLLVKPQFRAMVNLPAGAKLEEQKLPMTVKGAFAYDEQILAVEAGRPVAAVRQYRQAQADMKVSSTTKAPRLRADLGALTAVNEKSRVILASVSGPLTRDELDLVEVAGDPLAVDGILPTQPLEEHERWAVNEQAMGRLLGLTGVALCEVTGELDETNPGFARLNFKGRVHGAVDGGSAEFDVNGVALFDRKLRRITQTNLAITDRRPIGPATPGTDCVSKVRVQLKPIESSTLLTQPVIAAAKASLAKPQRELVLRTERQGYEVLHDRRWLVSAVERESTTLRCLGEQGLLGQTTLTLLPRRSADRHSKLADLQKDVQHSLGKNLKQIVATEDWKTAAGHHAIGLVANGDVDGVPVQWRYFLVAPMGEGHRIAFATTLETSQVERFAKSDRDLANRLRLIELPAGVTPSERIPITESQGKQITAKPAPPAKRPPARNARRAVSGPRLF